MLFLRGLYLEGLIYGGKFAFQIDRANLTDGRKFTVFALFYLVFQGNFQVQAPWGAYIWRGDLTDGFLRYKFGGPIFGRGLYMEGLIFGILWYFGVVQMLCFLFTPKTLCMNIDFKLRKQPSFRDVTTCFPAK